MSVRNLKPMTKAQVVSNPTRLYTGQGDGWFGLPSSILDGAPVFTWLDVPRMLRDERVQFGLRMLKSPFQKAKFEVKADQREVAVFVFRTVKKFWTKFVPRVLSRYFKWGCCPVGLEYEIERGRAVLHHCRPISPQDATPLEFKSGPEKGQFGGFRFADVTVCRPHAMWFAGEGELDKYHDRPRLAGAFEPWLEKRGKTGAVHSRRLAARTVAFRRRGIRYPNRDVNIGTDAEPVWIHGQVLARQIAENMETGSIPLYPNGPNPGMPTNYDWEDIPAEGQVNISATMEYPGILDKEILTGLGIPSEVLEAADVGSGWSGRKIPAEAFYGSLDEVVSNLLDCFDRECLRYLVALNFGDQRYEVEAKPLTEVVFGSDAKPGGAPQQPGEQPHGTTSGAPQVAPKGAFEGPQTSSRSVGKANYQGHNLSWGNLGKAIRLSFDETRANRIAARARDLSAMAEHSAKDKWISRKIKKIMREGVRGKKVSQKQAVAIAYSMWRKKHGGGEMSAVEEIVPLVAAE